MNHPKNAGPRLDGIRRHNSILMVLILTSVAMATAASRSSVPPARNASQEQPAQETFAKRDDTRPAPEVYKNIQIFKTTPANQILDIMKFFTRALGVRCEYCHVTAPGSQIPGFGAFSKDDMATKQRAREMLQMVGEIKPKYFSKLQKGPTCWTCHRGNSKPEIDPPPPPTPAS